MKRILFAAALACSALLAPAAAKAAEPIPIEALAELPFITAPTLSPDGRRIAATLNVSGEEKIGVFDLAAGPDAPARLLHTGDLSVRWYRWAGEGKLLVGVLTTVRLGPLPLPVTRVISFDVATGMLVQLGNGAGLLGDDVIHVDPVGRFILLSSQKDPFTPPSVHRIDLATGAAVLVQKERTGIWNWFADQQGVVRVGVDYGERRMRIFYREADGAPLRRIDSRRYNRDESVVDMIRFVADTSRGAIITNAVTGRFAVYDYDFDTDTIGETLFEHPEVDVTEMIVGEDGRIDGFLYEDDRPRTKWINPRLAAVQKEIEATFPGKSNLIRSQSRDGNRLLVWSGGADDPGTYYVFDQAARRMEAFASPRDRLEGVALAPVKPVRYAARDGLDIPGYLTLPRGRPGKGLPLIVMPHGGPFMRDGWSFDPWVQFLADRGYAVLQPNFRGSTGYGRDFVERGFGQWGTGMVDDMEDGVEWLVREGIVDRERVCIMGASYGGYAALWSAARNPGLYRCAISLNGVSDLRAILRYDSRNMGGQRYFRDWRRKLEGEERQDLAAISPLQQAARLRVPVLLAHGERDKRVPVAQSRDLHKALERHGAPVEAVFYPKAGHSFGRTEDSIDFLRRVEAFLARHNPS